MSIERSSRRGSDPLIVVWGAYDESKPRVRLLLDELEARGRLAARISIPVWEDVRDKAVAGNFQMLRALLRLVVSYPAALLKLWRLPSRGVILLAYPAIPDIFAVWPVARLRGHLIIFDAFISLHDTLVGDRALISERGLVASFVWWIEWLAMKLADIVIVDTDQHGDFFADEFGVQREKLQTILVGAEPAFWEARGSDDDRARPLTTATQYPTVLFYGQLIPLHGLDAILEAIRLTDSEPIHWLLIGSGQEEPKLRQFLKEHPSTKVTWLPWVNYSKLPAVIRSVELGLGIFGTSKKAARVIPNKAFQILAAGKPLITSNTPAVAALAQRYPGTIQTVPPGDGAALARAVTGTLERPDRTRAFPLSSAAKLGPGEGVDELIRGLTHHQ